MLVVLVLVVMLMLRAVVVLRLDALHAIEKAQGSGRVAAEGAEDVRHPCVALSAHIHEQITARKRQDVRRRGLEGVHLRTGLDQQLDLRLISRHGARKVVAGKAGADDAALSLRRMRRSQRTGGQRKQQRDTNEDFELPHGLSLLKSILKFNSDFIL